MHGLMSYRRFGRARSLRSDRAGRTLGRYVATELGSSSVATQRPSGTDARSLRSDRAWLELGRYTRSIPNSKWNSNKPTHSVLCEKQLVDRRGIGRNPMDDLTGLDWTDLDWDRTSA
ncbi:hypothetical protein F2Q68_00043101 [Brassica cretica]|uniref:Uncharacterized protein n=1 Tax=Brassica cretica TaxID=69181 RepID=A0A8S9LVE3_BRACR|nr:hypothetical protein F2Q68_00043101 [Brassica cretica]